MSRPGDLTNDPSSLEEYSLPGLLKRRIRRQEIAVACGVSCTNYFVVFFLLPFLHGKFTIPSPLPGADPTKQEDQGTERNLHGKFTEDLRVENEIKERDNNGSTKSV